MLNAFLMGLAGGQRAMTPLAAVSVAAARGTLPRGNGAPRIIANPLVAAGAVGLALLEMAGDKMHSAPNRIVPIGLTARFITAAVAGMALAPREQRWLGAAVGGTTAVAASFPGWAVRMAALRRFGQFATGVVEDAAVVAGAVSVVERAGGGR